MLPRKQKSFHLNVHFFFVLAVTRSHVYLSCTCRHVTTVNTDFFYQSLTVRRLKIRMSKTVKIIEMCVLCHLQRLYNFIMNVCYDKNILLIVKTERNKTFLLKCNLLPDFVGQ